MKVELDELDLFEELADKFRKDIVENLYDCLENSGLPDSEIESICGEFLAEFSVGLDQGEMKHVGKYYRPIVGFIDSHNLQFWDENSKLLMPYEAYHHHDKVWEEIDEVYEDVKLSRAKKDSTK